MRNKGILLLICGFLGGLAAPLPGPGLDEKATREALARETTSANLMYSLLLGLGYKSLEAQDATQRAGYSFANERLQVWGCRHREEIDRAVTCISARQTNSGTDFGVMIFFERKDRSLKLVKERKIEDRN